jgi:hemolysin activation/secretion protein
LSVSDKPLVTGDVDLDNTGGTSTGTERLGLNLYGNGVLGQGDLWSANLSANQGSNYARLGLTVPVGYGGLRLGLNASRLDYQVVAAQYSSLELHGASSVQGVDAVYPLLRSQTHNLYLSAALDDKHFLNYSATKAVSDYGSRALTWSLYGNAYDALGGGGASSGSLTLSQGHLNLDASATQASDALSTQTAGDYRKLRFALSRQQALHDDLTLVLSFSGQWTDQNLDSSEKFFLGGSTGVRAYPSGEGSGALGRMANAELRWRWRWSDSFALSAFYDTGSVTVNPRNGYAGASALNSYGLDGVGLGLAWSGERGVSAKLVWARRLGDNPNPSATGQDQDGTLVRDRLWASAQLAF